MERVRLAVFRRFSSSSLFSLILALQSFLGSLQLFDAFGVVYYPMIHRATREVRFELGFSLVLPLLILLVFWLGWVVWRRRFEALLFPTVGLFVYPFLGLEAFVSVASLLAVVTSLWFYQGFEKFFTGVLLLFGGLEALALLHWVVFVPLGLASPFEGFAWVEMGLYYLTGFLAPLLVLPLLFMWVLKPLVKWGWGKSTDRGIDFLGVRGRLSSRAILFFALSVFLGVASALYPYVSAVNPHGRIVGVDIPDYVEAARVVESDVSQVLTMWKGGRPFFFLVLFGFQRVIDSGASIAVKFFPVLLNPLLVVSMFFLALEVFGDEWIAGLASFFTVCGFQITVGMYSYSLANMLGLSLVFFSLGFLFRSLQRGCQISLAFACLFGGLLVYTHPWTFDQYFAAAVLTFCMVFYDARVRGGDYEKVKTMLVYLVSLGSADLLKFLVFKGLGGISASGEVVSRISRLSEFWYDSIFSFRFLYGGTLSTVILLSLSLLGVYFWGRNGVPEVYFNGFLIVTSILFLVGDEMIKSRLLYNVPVGFFSALVVIHFIRWKAEADFKKPLVVFVILNMVVYLFRSLANLV